MLASFLIHAFFLWYNNNFLQLINTSTSFGRITHGVVFVFSLSLLLLFVVTECYFFPMRFSCHIERFCNYFCFGIHLFLMFRVFDRLLLRYCQEFFHFLLFPIPILILIKSFSNSFILSTCGGQFTWYNGYLSVFWLSLLLLLLFSLFQFSRRKKLSILLALSLAQFFQ